MHEEPWRSDIWNVPEGVTVETKIDDKDGVRNVTTLKRGSGRLWFFPDDSMYVYYTPTHWRALSARALDQRGDDRE